MTRPRGCSRSFEPVKESTTSLIRHPREGTYEGIPSTLRRSPNPIGIGKTFASPPSEPCERFSRTRLSSHGFSASRVSRLCIGRGEGEQPMPSEEGVGPAPMVGLGVAPARPLLLLSIHPGGPAVAGDASPRRLQGRGTDHLWLRPPGAPATRRRGRRRRGPVPGPAPDAGSRGARPPTDARAAQTAVPAETFPAAPVGPSGAAGAGAAAAAGARRRGLGQ